MSNAIVTSILVDKNNGIWLGTLNNGLFYIRNAYTRRLLNGDCKNNGNFSDIVRVGNAMFAISDDKLFQLDYKNMGQKKLLQFPFKPSHIYYSNNRLIAYNLRQVVCCLRHNSRWVNDWEWLNRQSVNFHLTSIDDKVYIAGSRGLFVKQFGYPIKTLDADARIRFLVRFNNEIYAAADTVMWVIDKEGRRELFPIHEKIMYLGASNRYLFMATTSKGLTVLNAKGIQKQNFKKYQQINHITACDSLIYISTPRGLFVENVNSSDIKLSAAYNKLNGINGDDIHKTLCLSDYLYVMHEMGITITPKKVKPLYNYNLIVTSCQPIKKSKEGYKVVLDSDKSHVQLFFSDFNYALLRPSKLYFTVDEDSTKNTIVNNQLDLINLKSGITRIYLESESYGVSKKTGLNIEIYKEPSLDEEGWFQMAFAALFFLFLMFIIYSVITHL